MRAMEYQRRLLPAFGGAPGAIVYGGGSPGQSSQSMSQNTTTTSEPSPEIKGYLGQLATNAWNEGMQGGLNERDIVSSNALWQRGASGFGSGIDPAMRSYTADTLGGKYLDLTNNPYFQSAMTASLAPVTENFTKNIVPNIRSQWAGAGRPGAGLEQDKLNDAYTNFDRANADAVTKAGNEAFGRERGLQQATLGFLPSLQAIDYGNIDALKRASSPGQDKALQLAQILQAIFPGGRTTGSGTSTGSGSYQSPFNAASSGIGAGVSLLGAALPFIFSDERLKKNIRPVGKTYSGHNLYAYEFLGSTKPEIGVLAQEVEQKDPAAVVTHPTGYKMVNYDRIADHAGGLI